MVPDDADMLSVVIPSRLDDRTEPTVRALDAWAAARGVPFEIVVCGEPLPGQTFGPAQFIPVEPADKGACVRAGVLASRGSRILVIDADLPVSFEDIEKLVGALDGCDVAVGQRHQRSGDSDVRKPFIRRAATVVFRSMVHSLFDLPKDLDPQCGVKAFRGPAAKTLFRELDVAGLAFDVEVLVKAADLSMGMSSVPVEWQHGSSTVSLARHTARMTADVLRIRARRRRRG